MEQEFGEIEPKNAREYWEHEEQKFTPWLAEDGLSYLEDALNLELELMDTERSVGRYSLDILAEEANSGRTVVVENQLEDSDHDHLGKLLAYASGVDADVGVWIAPHFHDEHIDAVNWINENTQRGVDLFAINLEVWKIDESKPAVRLNPIEKPSEWRDRINTEDDRGELSELGERRLDYWTEFRDRIGEADTPLRPWKPRPKYWYTNPIGKSSFKIGFHVNKSFSVGSDSEKDKLRCQLEIRDDAEAFEELLEQKEEIEDELGEEAIWISPDETKGDGDRSYIALEREGNISNLDEWDGYQDWMLEKGELLHETFYDRIQEL
jgi:hypothetical protein